MSVAAAIWFYRVCLSTERGVLGRLFKSMLPHGFIFSGCRFFPSCSGYAQEAIRQYGLGRGFMLSWRRLLRCGPWSEGGYDPL